MGPQTSETRVFLDPGGGSLHGYSEGEQPHCPRTMQPPGVTGEHTHLNVNTPPCQRSRNQTGPGMAKRSQRGQKQTDLQECSN